VTVDDFRASTQDGTAAAPAFATPLLQALWYDARGDWARAHELAQEVDSRDGAWVHAYLHRKEGDIDNARYWYRRAGRPECAGTLPEEWSTIVAVLLANQR
jgi:hypothetical protein